MSDLATQWQALCARLHIHDADARWSQIVAAYSEPHRHYHTLDHIAAVVTLWGTVRDCFDDPDQALLALFYHDIVYDPARSDNEEKSALFLPKNHPKPTLNRTETHIKATQKHTENADSDTNLVLDIDMSILGAPWPDYLAYARNVAREFLPVYGLEAYAMGRVAIFLTPTLARDRIFLTPQFEHLNPLAHNNLLAERELWQSGNFGSI